MHGDGGGSGGFSARHRRAKSPAGTVIKWVLLAMAMIGIIVVVGIVH
jgi:hypothetical protein